MDNFDHRRMVLFGKITADNILYFPKTISNYVKPNAFTYWTQSRVFLDPLYAGPKPGTRSKRLVFAETQT
jgi:hypothetical protein